MRTIAVASILTGKGLKLKLTSDDKWLVDAIRTHTASHNFDAASISGEVQLYKTNKFVDIVASLRFTHFPPCARCGTELSKTASLNFQSHLAPLSDFITKTEEAPGETELTREDLDTCFYENDEIDLEPLFNDEVAIALPYNYYCKKNCQAPALNHAAQPDDATPDPRWQALKDVKIKKS